MSISAEQINNIFRIIDSGQEGKFDLLKQALEELKNEQGKIEWDEIREAKTGDSVISRVINLGDVEGVKEMVEFLVAKGADPDQLNSRSTTPMQDAIENENEARIQLLIAAGANLDQALFHAIATGEEDMVKLLLDGGAQANAVDSHGNIALCKVAATKNVSMLEMLLKAGADPNQPNQNNVTAFDLIIQDASASNKGLTGWNLDMVKLLVKFEMEFDPAKKSHLQLKSMFTDKKLEKAKLGENFGEKTTPAKAAGKRVVNFKPLKPSMREQNIST